MGQKVGRGGILGSATYAACPNLNAALPWTIVRQARIKEGLEGAEGKPGRRGKQVGVIRGGTGDGCEGTQEPGQSFTILVAFVSVVSHAHPPAWVCRCNKQHTAPICFVCPPLAHRKLQMGLSR